MVTRLVPFYVYALFWNVNFSEQTFGICDALSNSVPWWFSLRVLCDTRHHHLIDALKSVCLWKCPVSACAMFFVSVPSAPPSCSHLSWEGCKCPKRPQRISRHDRWRGSITRGMGLAYLCHQCWARRSHKQRWKNKNRYKMKRMEVLGW